MEIFGSVRMVRMVRRHQVMAGAICTHVLAQVGRPQAEAMRARYVLEILRREASRTRRRGRPSALAR